MEKKWKRKQEEHIDAAGEYETLESLEDFLFRKELEIRFDQQETDCTIPPMLFCLLPDCLVRWYNVYGWSNRIFQLFFSEKCRKSSRDSMSSYSPAASIYFLRFRFQYFHGSVNGHAPLSLSFTGSIPPMIVPIDRNNTQIQILFSHQRERMCLGTSFSNPSYKIPFHISIQTAITRNAIT